MADDCTERYRDLLTGWYDCVDQIALNAYYPMGNPAGGFRTCRRPALADGYRAELVRAARNGLAFAPGTGEPVAWAAPEPEPMTWYRQRWRTRR